MNEKAEQARMKHKYRRLILSGKVVLPPDAAVRLIGPDCAYHLYRTYSGKPLMAEGGSDSSERADTSDRSD